MSFRHGPFSVWGELSFPLQRIHKSPQFLSLVLLLLQNNQHDDHHADHEAVTRLELSTPHQQSLQTVKQKHHGATSPRNHWKEQ
jgi:hypothetical protein